MKEVNGWWLPDDDSYFHKHTSQRNDSQFGGGFQTGHLIAALPFVSNNALAIDCGAHVGFWSAVLAREFREVVALEAAPDTFDCLKKNCENLPNVQVLHAAASNKMGQCGVYEDPTRKGNTGSRYIGDGWAIKRLTLDSLDLDHCGLLKIDVEGHEFQVLMGAQKLIKQHSPVIIMETDKRFEYRYHTVEGAAETWLKDQGYRPVIHMRPDKVFIR